MSDVMWELADGSSLSMDDQGVTNDAMVNMVVRSLVETGMVVTSDVYPFVNRPASLASQFDAIVAVEFALGLMGREVVSAPVPDVFVGREGDIDAPALPPMLKGKFASKSEAAKFAAEQRWKNHQKKTEDGGQTTKPETAEKPDILSQYDREGMVRDSRKKHDQLKIKFNNGETSDYEDSILEAYKVLHAYTYGGYVNMNASLRGEDEQEDRNDSFVGEDKNGDDAAQRLLEHWDDIAVPLKKDVVVFRGIILDEDEEWVVGDKWLEEGFMSTSASAAIAGNFTVDAVRGQRAVTIRITIPKGTMVVIPDNPDFEKEEEVILKPGTELKLVDVKDSSKSDQWVSSSLWTAEVAA